MSQLQFDFTGIASVWDATGLDLDLILPDGVEHRLCDLADLSKADSGTLALIALGPNHGGRDKLASLLGVLRPDVPLAVLLGWTIDTLPDWLLPLLAETGSRIVQANRTDVPTLSGTEITIVIAPGATSAEARDSQSRVTGALREFEASRVAELGHDAEAGSLPEVAHDVEASRPAAMSEAEANLRALAAVRSEVLEWRAVELNRQLREARTRLASVEAEVRALKASGSYRAGKALAHAAKAPMRGLVSVPRELGRIWRGRQRRDRQVTVPIALPTGTLITMTGSADLLVPKRLAEEGLVGFEPSTLACFLAAIDVAGPGAVYDVGANVGIYAALASATTDREVYAFEPFPLLTTVARGVSAENELGFTVEGIALGAENGEATFYLSDSSDSSNSLVAGFRPSSRQIQVPVETLDSYVDRTGAVPAVIKVDTESTEPDVLRGALGTLREHRPWILCEVLAHRVEARLHEVLGPLGYRWYHITDELPLRESLHITGDETYEHLMWMFAPEKPGAEFWAAMRAHTAALTNCTAARARQLLAAR